MSADGSIAVGVRNNFGPASRLTAQTGTVDIGGDGFQAKISRDGKSIVSNAKDSTGFSSAAIWLGGTKWRTLGGLPGGEASGETLSTAFSVSADGSVIVGLGCVTPGRAHGFRWDALNGIVDLESLQGQNSRASVVSADGNIVLGWGENPPRDQTFDYGLWRGAM